MNPALYWGMFLKSSSKIISTDQNGYTSENTRTKISKCPGSDGLAVELYMFKILACVFSSVYPFWSVDIILEVFERFNSNHHKKHSPVERGVPSGNSCL